MSSSATTAPSERTASASGEPGLSTRDRLVATAARLFHEQGFHATGVSTILREAGVLAGSMYHYFPSKEDLLVAVLERYRELLKPEVMDRAEKLTDDPIERVFALLGLYRYGLELTSTSLGCPIGNLALEIADGSPSARAVVDANFQGWTEHVRGWLSQAGARFLPGTDLDALSVLVLTVMEGGIMQARARRSLEPFDASVAELRRYFNLLLSTDRGPPASG
jgi:TetR/AcrR family transcriptional regulator, transcriptional repressor for nem operon